MGNRHRPLLLCYHALSDNWDSDLAVSKEQFTSLLEQLAERGYRGVTLSEAERLRASGTRTKCLAVTFDDGFKSVLAARPILDRLGFLATVFVVTDFVSTTRPFDWYGMEPWLGSHHRHELESVSWQDCKELQAAGWEIGSHTATHPVLPLIDAERSLDELTRSRAAVIEQLGSCSTLAYPYGQATRDTAAQAARAGYTTACTLSFAQRPDLPLLRPRIGLVRGDSARRTMLKVNPLVNAARRTPLADLIQRARLTGSSRQILRGGSE
jgi:peptidoglycan/xylan/chitin deacetylase (PgdA/CDA1 family)